MSPTKSILAKAVVPNNFTKRFAVYNLSRFLGTVSLMSEPNLEFSDSYVKIFDENKSVNFTYADESAIKAAPEKDLVLPSVDVKFSLTDKNLKEVIRAAGVLELPEIAIVGDGSKIKIQALDGDNPSGNVFNIDLGETDKTFRIIFKVENIIKLMNVDYEVDISSKGIAHFKNPEIEYWVLVSSTSTYGA
jgi:hypothetical protein